MVAYFVAAIGVLIALLGIVITIAPAPFRQIAGAPDLVLSGVNRGQNIADDVTYSGTIAGAMEGTLLGIPSIALSQAYDFGSGDEPPWETATSHGPKVIRRIMEAGIAPGTLININFPNRAPDDVAGTMVTSQGERVPDWLHVEERKDGRGNPYYWIGFRRSHSEPEEGSDLKALAEGMISVTPLALDLTNHAAQNALKAALG